MQVSFLLSEVFDLMVHKQGTRFRRSVSTDFIQTPSLSVSQHKGVQRRSPSSSWRCSSNGSAPLPHKTRRFNAASRLPAKTESNLGSGTSGKPSESPGEPAPSQSNRSRREPHGFEDSSRNRFRPFRLQGAHLKTVSRQQRPCTVRTGVEYCSQMRTNLRTFA